MFVELNEADIKLRTKETIIMVIAVILILVYPIVLGVDVHEDESWTITMDVVFAKYYSQIWPGVLIVTILLFLCSGYLMYIL